MVAEAVADGERLLILGGDCCAHAGAMAGLRRARPERRLAIAWFDAHGDFNTPESTPSGNVWGMPFAMLCGRGAEDLVGACDGPTVDDRHATLIGGQVLDEAESRSISASRIAHFGAGMLGTPAGSAGLGAWATSVGREVDGLYIAVDLDVLDADERPGRSRCRSRPVFRWRPRWRSSARWRRPYRSSATAPRPLNFAHGDGGRTFDAATRLVEAAFADG